MQQLQQTPNSSQVPSHGDVPPPPALLAFACDELACVPLAILASILSMFFSITAIASSSVMKLGIFSPSAILA
jgi:hypothetical protein